MTHGRIISARMYGNELLDELSVDRDFYNYRERNEDEIFPWDFIDIGVSKTVFYAVNMKMQSRER